MSVQSEINRLKQNVSDAFTAIFNKGGTVPSSKVSGNLASAINTIPDGAELNFKVVGGTTRPSDPKENTIWVNTSTNITGWIFSATELINTPPGVVWFAVGSSSDMEFNALKENTLCVYPQKIYQRIADEWEQRGGEIYQSGGWKEFITLEYVIYKGELKESFQIETTTATYEHIGECLVFKSTKASSGNGSIKISNAGQDIDLSNYSTLYYDIEATSPRSGTSDFIRIGVSGGSSITKNLGIDDPVTRQIFPIDISGLSGGTLNMFISDNPATVELKVYNVWPE